jgi:hypothetical protein
MLRVSPAFKFWPIIPRPEGVSTRLRGGVRAKHVRRPVGGRAKNATATKCLAQHRAVPHGGAPRGVPRAECAVMLGGRDASRVRLCGVIAPAKQKGIAGAMPGECI